MSWPVDAVAMHGDAGYADSAGPHQLLDHAALLQRTEIRSDAQAKLAGNPGYLTDRIHPGQLFGAMLGSPHPHVRILSIDTRAALQSPGVRAVVTAADIPGQKTYGYRTADRPFLCGEKVRCIADPVAAVAADTPAQAQAALALIRVDYEVLPTVDEMETAPAPRPCTRAAICCTAFAMRAAT
ncbi:MAG: hypothetical protein MO853_10680 [Candidatus Protistobacter heckmanni]|nr:hypothetical protein [Candidatus Protistobacter heckmanni]